MTEICWFCKKQAGDTANSFRVPVIKILDVQESRAPVESKHFVNNNIRVTTTTKYLKEEVQVPRCSTCAHLHSNAKMIKVVGIILPIVVVLLSFLVSFLSPVDSEIRGFTGFVSICGFFAIPVFLLVGMLAGTEYLRRKGILPVSDKIKYPAVLAYQAKGYHVVKK